MAHSFDDRIRVVRRVHVPRVNTLDELSKVVFGRHGLFTATCFSATQNVIERTQVHVTDEDLPVVRELIRRYWVDFIKNYVDSPYVEIGQCEFNESIVNIAWEAVLQ